MSYSPPRTNAPSVGASGRVTIYTNSAAAKSAWVEVVASTSGVADELELVVDGANTTVTSLIDVGIGAAASETVLVPNLLVQHTGAAVHAVKLPVAVPSGSRLSVRGQSSLASAALNARLIARNTGRVGGGSATTYGAGTAAGTDIDPGGSIGTKGSWVQLTASTTAPGTRAIVSIGNNENFARVANSTWLLDIGVGAAASEVVVLGDLPLHSPSTNGGVLPNFHGPYEVAIPTGSRLVARASSTTADATDRLFDVAVTLVNVS